MLRQSPFIYSTLVYFLPLALIYTAKFLGGKEEGREGERGKLPNLLTK